LNLKKPEICFMKTIQITLLFFLFLFYNHPTQGKAHDLTQISQEEEVIKIESRIPGLKLALTHQSAKNHNNDFAVLFLHGSSFPSMLSFAYRMEGYSWMDYLSENGYEVYALDFLGYGNSDRYPEMHNENPAGKGLGRANEVYQDVDKAVEFIKTATGKSQIYLIGHSWGGSVAALYASRFPDKVAKLILYASITGREEYAGEGETPDISYEQLTPGHRVELMRSLTPKGEVCQLESEIFNGWGSQWLASDLLSAKLKSEMVRFPAGYKQDVYELLHGKPYYKAQDIKAPSLIIRGEWDSYPNNADCKKMLKDLTNSPNKKYVVIENGTHVLHLEKQRDMLYAEVYKFLQGHDDEEIK